MPFSTAVQDPPPGEDGDETDEGEEDGEYEDEEDGDEDEDEEDEEAESRASVRKLAEYELISSFRQSTAGRHPKATVDDFHRFLLTLRGEQGRYWALVACLLSVQCLDTVALRAVRALMQLCPGGAADVGGLSDDDLAGALSSLNYFKSKVKYLKGCTEAVLVDGAFPSLVTTAAAAATIRTMTAAAAAAAVATTTVVRDDYRSGGGAGGRPCECRRT